MAWELQSHIDVHYSVEQYLAEHDDPAVETARILGYQRGGNLKGFDDLPKIEALQRGIDAEVARFGWACFVSEIAEHAEMVGLTSNGGWDIYLDSDGWCEVPVRDHPERCLP